MPRKGKGKKKTPQQISMSRKLTDSLTAIHRGATVAFERLAEQSEKAAKAARGLGKVLDPIMEMAKSAKELSDRKRKRNRRNKRILKAPCHSELPLNAAVVVGGDGYARTARHDEEPIGFVMGRSQRIRRGVPTFYASVAQDVERPSETREVEGSRLPEAPDYREVEKAVIHGMNYGMGPSRLDEMYGGGNRARERGEDISEFIERRERGETSEADDSGSEHARVLRRPEWQREGSRPAWYYAEGKKSGATRGEEG